MGVVWLQWVAVMGGGTKTFEYCFFSVSSFHL